ncbi:hypothetical protein [Pyrococcus kukulkanii]|uniref:SpoVT-AbrB domain-containing protein n=1 Tax=Pyrococcus kukulkanii TaxID=1609559 RepID=A0ABV4T899_9EURY
MIVTAQKVGENSVEVVLPKKTAQELDIREGLELYAHYDNGSILFSRTKESPYKVKVREGTSPRITIPKEINTLLNIEPGYFLEVVKLDDGFKLIPREEITLEEFLEHLDKVFREVYEFMKKDLMVKLPDDIKVAAWPVVEKKYRPRPTVLAIAEPHSKTIAFRYTRPSLIDFIHELIHLAGGDEVYAADISPIILFAFKNRNKIKTPIDIMKIFDAFTLEDLNKIVQKYGLKDIKDYYRVSGVVPYLYDPNYNRLPEYTEKDEVFAFILEVSAGAPYGYIHEKLMIDVLNELAERTGNAPSESERK